MITFRQSRVKLALKLVLTGGLALALGFAGFVVMHFPGFWAPLGLAIFVPLALAVAVSAVFTGLALANPAVISAGPNSVSVATHRGKREIAWQDIAQFCVFSPASRFRSPGLELKAPVNGRRFVSFGRHWQAEPETIVNALQQAAPTSSL